VASGPVETLRAVKEPAEIEALRRSGSLSDEVFSALAGERFTGRTERELASWIEQAFREGGAEGLSFPSIVAAGANGASPHAEPSDPAMGPGDLLDRDARSDAHGLCS